MARIGAPRIFFNVVGNFQAAKMLDDASAQMTVLNAIFMDGLGGMEDAAVALAEQMTMVVEATVPISAEIEKATLEFEKFLSVGDDISERLTGEIIGIGAQVGFTATESLSAGARMAQLAGIFGDEVIPAATEMALAFGLIGDMAPEDAMIKLINLQQQTNFVFREVEKSSYDLLSAEQQRMQVQKEMSRVINQLNSVEDKSAATMSKIVRVMNEFASQARLTGEEISFMAAMSATLIEAGEEQGKAGRALRMIYARLGADTNGAATALHNLGIATTDANGGLRPLSAILADLTPLYHDMGSAQKQQIAQQVAGNLHYVRFLKLAEGFDRVIDLQQEALGETGAVFNEAGESVGFLSDMMESNNTQLEKAKAELEAVNAQLGDVLIPSTIAATEFQRDFNAALVSTIEFLPALGTGMEGFFAFQQKMSGTFAPFFTLNLNLKALLISMNTFQQITRAMDGAVLARDQQSASSHEKKMQHMSELQLQHNNVIQDLKEEKLALESLNVTRNMAIGKTRQIGSLQVEQDNFNTAFYKRQALFKEHDIDLTTQNIYKLELEEGVRQELELAIEEQTIAMDALFVATEKRMSQLPELIMKEQEAQMASGDNAIYITDETEAIKRKTQAREKSIFALEAETIASTKTSMAFMKLGGGIMLADMGVMMFSKKIDKMLGQGRSAQISLALTSAQMFVMMAETVITSMAISTLAKKQAEQAAISTGTTVPANRAAATSFVRLRAGVATLSGAFMSMLPILAVVGLAYMALTKHPMTKLGSKARENTRDLDIMNKSMRQLEETGRKARLSSAVDVAGLSQAKDDIEEFAGAREEMFFGFKAGAVTGDLVKQVSMGGVENFVANTEVIMTNNFNGMTTEEVADIIIAELQSRGKANNINMVV